VVTHLLPALRVEIAKNLIDKYDLKKIEAAEKMGLTPAAVTQYLKGSRGGKYPLSKDSQIKIKELIQEISYELVNKETPSDDLALRLCEACKSIRT
jgi:predicted transcriptional regulator